jgi:hypothetical protein
MKLKFPIVLTFLLMPCFTSMPLRADELTAGELLSFCTSTDQVASTASMCSVSYKESALGTVHTWMRRQSLWRKRKRSFAFLIIRRRQRPETGFDRDCVADAAVQLVVY